MKIKIYKRFISWIKLLKLNCVEISKNHKKHTISAAIEKCELIKDNLPKKKDKLRKAYTFK